MRVVSLLMILFILTSPVEALQMAMSFSEAEAADISIEEIDSRYSDAIHVNPRLAVFSDNQSEFIRQYREFIQNLALYLNENEFFWDEPKRVFNRIYFSEDGSVEYFFYNDNHTGFNSTEIRNFNRLVSEFIQNNRLNIKAESAFAQCSPVVYSNVIDPN